MNFSFHFVADDGAAKERGKWMCYYLMAAIATTAHDIL